MKLQAVTNGRVYASRGRTVVVDGSDGAFEPLGQIPNPHTGMDALRYEIVTTPPWRSAVGWVVGAYQTTNVWPITESVLVATVWRQLFVSHDGGQQWHHAHQLPRSSGISGVLPTGLCVHDGAIYLGEYPLDDDDVARILHSTDNGRTWTTVLELPEVRHIHAICTDPYTGELWITTGDRDAECNIGRLRNGAFEIVGGGDQRWRAVDLVFTPSAVLWGMDCAYTDRNHIFRLDRDDIPDERTRPTLGVCPGTEPQANRGRTPDREDGLHPTSVTSVPNSVYFGTSLTIDDTQWVVFSTAVETGGDSTAPQWVRASTDTDNNTGSDTARVIGAKATSGFTDWYEIGRFRRRTQPIRYLTPSGRLPNANAYIFLGRDDDSLLINPFNTTTDHGRILTVSPETIAQLATEQ